MTLYTKLFYQSHFFSFFIFHFRSNRYAEALANYEKGMDKMTLDQLQLSEAALEEHKQMCKFGLARTNIKLGNFKKGVRTKNRISYYKWLISYVTSIDYSCYRAE